MAGRGPIPKEASKRARRNSDPMGVRVVTSEPQPQPELPTSAPGGKEWPQETLDWWRMWGSDPLAAEFRATDWAELMDTAAIHAAFWSGDIGRAGELRLRTAKFGATAEDRARLRIQYAAADEADDKRAARRERAKPAARYEGLRAVN